jgi:hypothetical protein
MVPVAGGRNKGVQFKTFSCGVYSVYWFCVIDFVAPGLLKELRKI